MSPTPRRVSVDDQSMSSLTGPGVQPAGWLVSLPYHSAGTAAVPTSLLHDSPSELSADFQPAFQRRRWWNQRPGLPVAQSGHYVIGPESKNRYGGERTHAQRHKRHYKVTQSKSKHEERK